MNPASHDGNLDFDASLTAWLYEAGDVDMGDVGPQLERGRQALLARLDAAAPGQIVAAPRSMRNVGSWVSRRVALSGLGATAAIVALVMAALQFGRPLSAMERASRQLREVSSYNYRLHWQTKWTEDEGRRAIYTQGDGVAYWQQPDAFHNEMTIIKVERDLPDGKPREQSLERFAEVFPQGQRGVLVDYLRKTYVRIPFDPTGSKTYPWEILRCVREGSYEVERELGSKRIGGVKASGFVLVLKNVSKSITLHDPVELWVDQQTDLPLELSYGGRNEGSTYINRAHDFRWNIDLDPKLFEATPPADCTDITPPTDAQDLEQIAESLRQFARLSGGHYPRTKDFEAATIYDELKESAGFAGPKQPAWAMDPKYREIEQTKAGLGWIERILRNRFLSGYRGAEVNPADKDQVLLWWMASADRYRVYYGDLRTEVVSEAQWSQLVPQADRN